MEGRWDGEQVRVGLVLVGLGQVVGVAGKDALADDERGSVVLGSVGVRAVEDWRVENIGDVIDRRVGHVGIGRVQLPAKRFVRLNRRSSEEGSFVRVVTDHDVDILVESALSKQLSGLERNEASIDARAVHELAVGGIVRNLLGIGAHNDLGRKSTQLGEGCSVCEVQELAVGVLQLDVGLHGLPSGTLWDGLLEWGLALESTVGCDLVHDGTSTCRLAENCNAVLVTSEQVDVLLYPFQSEALVVETNIGSSAFSLERGTSLPSKRTETVVEGHVDHIAV